MDKIATAAGVARPLFPQRVPEPEPATKADLILLRAELLEQPVNRAVMVWTLVGLALLALLVMNLALPLLRFALEG